MPRPKKTRRLNFKPDVYYFKPRGIPLSELEEVILEHDELEALKLHDVDELEHKDAAKKMDISQSTFTRILNKAYKNIADGIINGKAIRIEKKHE
jgi:uncharacterized protein